MNLKFIAIFLFVAIGLVIIPSHLVQARTVYVYICCVGTDDRSVHHTVKVISGLTGTVHKKNVDLGKLAGKQDWDDVFVRFHLKTGDVGFKACVDGGHCKQTSGSNNEVHLHL